MSDAYKITGVLISAKSSEMLTGILQVNTADAEIKFEITEDLAHRICIDLERFLTRKRFADPVSRSATIGLNNSRKN
jgi:hypothetical protein